MHAFRPGFEFDLFNAMWRYLPDFREIAEEPKDITQCRREIKTKFYLLRNCSPELRATIFTRSIFRYIYEPENSDLVEQIGWIMVNKRSEYRRIVDIGIGIAKDLLEDSQRLNNDQELLDRYADLRFRMASLVHAYLEFKYIAH